MLYFKHKNRYTICIIVSLFSYYATGLCQEISPKQLYRSGIHYYYGIGGMQFNKAKAQELIKESARKGYDKAIEDIFVYLDCEDAMATLREAADSGNTTAYNMLSRVYSSGLSKQNNCNKYSPSLCHLFAKSSAEKGDSQGMYLYSRCLLDGAGVATNVPDGSFWIIKSAESGNVEAMYFLADVYKNGMYGFNIDSVQYDYWIKKASITEHSILEKHFSFSEDNTTYVNWRTQAAEQGNVDAIWELIIYYDSIGDNRSEVYWFKKGIASGNPFMKFWFAKKLFREELSSPDNDPIELMRQSAEQEYEPAFYWISFFYYLGYHLTKDVNEAKKWCKLGISKYENEDCYFLLTEILRDENIASDERISVLYKLSKKGNQSAAAELAYLNVEELIPNADRKQGLRTLEDLSRKGNPRAMCWYGVFLLTGEHIRQDIHKGIWLIRSAAQKGDLRAVFIHESAEELYSKLKYY